MSFYSYKSEILRLCYDNTFFYIYILSHKLKFRNFLLNLLALVLVIKNIRVLDSQKMFTLLLFISLLLFIPNKVNNYNSKVTINYNLFEMCIAFTRLHLH